MTSWWPGSASPRSLRRHSCSGGCAGGASCSSRLRSRRPRVGLAAAHRIEDRINTGRYRGVDPAIDGLLQAAPSGHRIGLASDWSVGGVSPVWPAFGTRIGNEVEFVGHFVRGFMTPYRSAAEFQAALRRGRFDLLVVGRGFYPPEATPEQRWAIDAGWRTIALSKRLRVLAAPST